MMPRTRLHFVFVFALLIAPLRAEIEFAGIFVTSRQSQFALMDKSSGESGWRKLGQSFAGAELTGYDAKEDTLVLSQNGATLRLRLKDAKVKAARVEIAGVISLGPAEKMEVIRGMLVFDQENVFPLSDGLVCRITPSLRPDGNILYRAFFEQTGPDGKVETLNAPSVIVLPDSPFAIRIGELGFSFTPKPRPTP
jgi:hypothetical protein